MKHPPEARADLYQRASAQAFAALQQAALDAIETVEIAGDVIKALECLPGIDPDQRYQIVWMIQRIPAVRAQRAADKFQHEQEDKG
jgi:hypothetical protein